MNNPSPINGGGPERSHALIVRDTASAGTTESQTQPYSRTFLAKVLHAGHISLYSHLRHPDDPMRPDAWYTNMLSSLHQGQGRFVAPNQNPAGVYESISRGGGFYLGEVDKAGQIPVVLASIVIETPEKPKTPDASGSKRSEALQFQLGLPLTLIAEGLRIIAPENLYPAEVKDINPQEAAQRLIEHHSSPPLRLPQGKEKFVYDWLAHDLAVNADQGPKQNFINAVRLLSSRVVKMPVE